MKFSRCEKFNFRKVVIATNIAETSVTIPGVTHVVDGCRFVVEVQVNFVLGTASSVCREKHYQLTTSQSQLSLHCLVF